MRASTDCTIRADECRRLAKLAARPEDWQHFLEMATTWDMLAKQRKADEHVAEAVERVAEAEEQVAEAAEREADADEAERVADTDEQVAEEQPADEQIADEQLAAILALTDAIANGRNLGLGPTGN